VRKNFRLYEVTVQANENRATASMIMLFTMTWAHLTKTQNLNGPTWVETRSIHSLAEFEQGDPLQNVVSVLCNIEIQTVASAPSKLIALQFGVHIDGAHQMMS
jgi:hypothetical protein